MLDFWEYSHGFDSEDGAVSIDEDITFEASQQELQIELEHFNEMDLEQELHPIKDNDFQPEDEHPNKTMLKRELRAIALKRLEDGARTVSDFEEVIKEWDHLDDNRERKERYHEIGRENIDSKKDVAPLAIVIPAPITHAYWRQLMKGDYIDIISNCPYEMHNSLSDEDYSKIIYDLKDDHKELIYFLYLRDFTTSQLAALPTTPDFITYEAVYLPKNHFIKEESITTEKYMSYFFPFDKIDFRKMGVESSWSTDCVEMIALIMTMKNKPQAVMMSFQKEYAEPYEWLVEVFRDWAWRLSAVWHLPTA